MLIAGIPCALIFVLASLCLPDVLPRYGFGDGFGINEVVLVGLAEGFTNWAGISRTSWP